MMRTRARGSVQIKKQHFIKASAAIEEGIEELETFYRENGRGISWPEAGELASPARLAGRSSRAASADGNRKLQQELDKAIRAEDYERAAEVRDQMRKLQASDS